MQDDLGDRMKEYEGVESNRRLIPLLPVIARLDGRCFSSFTKNMERPFCEPFHRLMSWTLSCLAMHSNATVGYTQSDEITLVWINDDYKSQIFFDRRIQKMTSVLASLCSVWFNRFLPMHLGAVPLEDKIPVFDCRVWNVPNLDEAANVVLWREKDATKNSILMTGQHHFSHKALQGLSCDQIQEKLFAEKGINWNDQPVAFKRGTYCVKRTSTGRPTIKELSELPPKHHARTDPNFTMERSFYALDHFPVKLSGIRNRVGVLFRGEVPEIVEESPSPD